MSLAKEKLRAREQWSQDPCGAEYDREHELGTREFFDEIERHRYSEYAAWMPQLMGFENFRGFNGFREVKIEVEQLTRDELRFLSPLVSEAMLDRLRKRIGWNVIITAIK